MRVEVLVNYEIPSLNTSPTLNLVQSYIFFPWTCFFFVHHVTFFSWVCFFFCWRKIHWSWIYLYIVIDAYMYLRMELCVRGYNFWQYVWTVLLMYIYVCLYLLWKGGMQEWGFISCKEWVILYFIWMEVYGESFVVMINVQILLFYLYLWCVFDGNTRDSL